MLVQPVAAVPMVLAVQRLAQSVPQAAAYQPYGLLAAASPFEPRAEARQRVARSAFRARVVALLLRVALLPSRPQRSSFP